MLTGMKKNMLKPTKGNIVLSVIEKDIKTKGGVFLPGKENKKELRYEVVAVGEGVSVEEGTTVFVSAGSPVSYKGEPYLITNEESILATV